MLQANTHIQANLSSKKGKENVSIVTVELATNPGPRVTAKVDVSGLDPIVVELTLTSQNGAGLFSEHYADYVNLAKILARVTAPHLVAAEGLKIQTEKVRVPKQSARPPAKKLTRKAPESRRPRTKAPDDADLAAVIAQVGSGRGTAAAVADAYNVSTQTAGRWIRTFRQKGIVDEG